MYNESTQGRQDRLTVSVAEAGRRLGISRGLMYEAIRRGEIPSIRIGRRILIPVAPLDKLCSVAE